MNRILISCALLFCMQGYSQAEDATKHPSEWLRETLQERKAAGGESREVFPDVVEVLDASGTEYFLRLPEGDQKLTKEEWLEKAAVGSSFPDAKEPFSELAKGYMLYSSRLHQEDEEEWHNLRREVFQEFQKQGVNALVYLTYIPPDGWPALREAAEESDLDLIVQYHAAYYNPDRRPDIWEDEERAQERRGVALAFLEEVFREGPSERFTGFAIREEPYLSFLPGMHEYHEQLREHFPNIPIYTLYNAVRAMEETPEPAPEIMGANQYPFFSTYLSPEGPHSERPFFVSPQRALLWLAARMKPSAEAAMAKGAVFTYTPVLDGYTSKMDVAKAKEFGWPTEGYVGIFSAPDEEVIYWRRYTPPPQAIRGSIWISAAYGALGWFPWTGYNQLSMPWMPPEEPYWEVFANDGGEWSDGKPAYRGHIQTDQRENWKAYLDTLEEIAAFEPLLLNLRLDPQPRLETDDPLLVAASHRIRGEDGDDRVLMLVNLDVGRWQDYPRVDNRTDSAALNVTMDGQLTGFEPLTEPREVEFTLRLQKDEAVRDIRTGEILEPLEELEPGHWRFIHPVDPGGAAVLFAGTEEVFDRAVADLLSNNGNSSN